MAAFLLLVQLLFMGTLIIPAHTQKEEGGCDLLPKATASNVTVQVTPAAYQANTTYTGKPAPSGCQSFLSAQKRGSSALSPAAFWSLVVFLDLRFNFF